MPGGETGYGPHPKPAASTEGAPAFGRTAYGAGRHIIRVRPCFPQPWPAVSWCGRRLNQPAGDDRMLCGMCERIHAAAEDRARRLPDPGAAAKITGRHGGHCTGRAT